MAQIAVATARCPQPSGGAYNESGVDAPYEPDRFRCADCCERRPARADLFGGGKPVTTGCPRSAVCFSWVARFGSLCCHERWDVVSAASVGEYDESGGDASREIGVLVNAGVCPGPVGSVRSVVLCAVHRPWAAGAVENPATRGLIVTERA